MLTKLFVGVAILFALLTSSVAGSKSGMTKLMVGNPYRIFLRLEVKCDWQPEVRKYYFYQIVDVPKKKNISIIVPSGMRFCEIWPMDFKLF